MTRFASISPYTGYPPSAARTVNPYAPPFRQPLATPYSHAVEALSHAGRPNYTGIRHHRHPGHPGHPGISAVFPFASPGTMESRVLQLAQAFHQAVTRSKGLDHEAVKSIAEEVHRDSLYPAFAQAVAMVFRNAGEAVRSPLEAVQERQQAFNRFKRAMTGARMKSVEDFVATGQDRYRATPMEYRFQGMWDAMDTFLSACFQHPLLSMAVIGGVAYSGHRWPFWGAISGVAILAWSSMVSTFNEVKAARLPGPMTAEKAAHYHTSGENILAFLMTATGGDAIAKSFIHGKNVFVETVRAVNNGSLVSRAWNATKTAFLSHPSEESLQGAGKARQIFEQFRFLSGLLDNVLLPAIAFTDYLEGRARQRR